MIEARTSIIQLKHETNGEKYFGVIIGPDEYVEKFLVDNKSDPPYWGTVFEATPFDTHEECQAALHLSFQKIN